MLRLIQIYKAKTSYQRRLSGKIKGYVIKINNNEEEINKIKKRLELESTLHSLDKRISILENLKKSKKGIMDPRIIIIIMILVVFILYLRAIGIIGS